MERHRTINKYKNSTEQETNIKNINIKEEFIRRL